MLTSREATEAPRQGSRSPLSPTEVTESATVRLFLILSALLCSVNNVDLRLLYRLRLLSRSPHKTGGSKVIRGIIARKEGEPGNEATWERLPNNCMRV